MADYRFIAASSDGWLTVLRYPEGQKVSLPEHLKVKYLSAEANRDIFRVYEGVERGKKFSVKREYLRNESPNYQTPAVLKFSVSQEKLRGYNIDIEAVTDSNNPIKIGRYPIQIPDSPHSGGTFYISQSAWAKSWFYLGVGNAVRGNNDRYLHAGRISAGCITVEPSQWTRLYQYLILCRSSDRESVGFIDVIR